MADEPAVHNQIANGWVKFSIGGQYLVWNTGTENIFTSNPIDEDGELLSGEDLAAVTVEGGDQVGDGYDTTYWTVGEGPVECVLGTVEDAVIYNGTPYFRAEGSVISVHPTQDQLESGSIGDGINHADYVDDTSLGLTLSEYLKVPVEKAEITGTHGTDDTAILVAVLGALDGLGLITDSTTNGE